MLQQLADEGFTIADGMGDLQALELSQYNYTKNGWGTGMGCEERAQQTNTSITSCQQQNAINTVLDPSSNIIGATLNYDTLPPMSKAVWHTIHYFHPNY
jgi:hypothetical protein